MRLLRTLFVSIALIAPWVGRGADTTGKEALDRRAAALAAELLVRQLREDAVRHPVDADALCRDMTERQSAYVERSAGEKLSRELAAKQLDQWYRREVADALKKIEAERGQNASVFDAAFKERAMALPENRREEALAKNFPEAFRVAREKACAAQRESLIADIYPTEEEFERGPRAAARASLAARVIAKQKTPVFQENRDFINEKIVDPILDDAERQLKAQRAALGTPVNDPEAFLPGDFAGKLAKQVMAAVADNADGTKYRRYGVFPSVAAAVAPTSERAATGKFAASLGAMRFPVPEDRIERDIAADTRLYRSRDTSKKTLSERFSAEFSKQAIGAYAKSAPDTKRPRVEAFLSAEAAKDQTCRQALAALADRSLTPAFIKAREKISAEQRARYFSSLTGLAWVPPTALVEAYYKNGDKPFSTDPLRVAGVASGKPDFSALLQETEEGATKDVVAIAANARKALARQMAISEQTQKKLNDAIGPDRAPGFLKRLMVSLGLDETKGLPTLDALTDRYRRLVEEQWRSERIKTVWGDGPKPINYREKYLELFPMVKEDISRRTKAILKDKTIVEDAPEKKSLAEKTPEGPSTAFKLEIDYVRDVIAVKMSRDGKPIPRTFEMSALAADYDANEAKLLNELAAAFRKAIDEKNGRPKNLKINVSIMVYNGMVYYRFVSNLRQKFRDVAETLKRDGLDTRLEDRLYKR